MWYGSLPAKLTSVVPRKACPDTTIWLALLEQAAQANKKSQEIPAGLQDSILLQDDPAVIARQARR